MHTQFYSLIRGGLTHGILLFLCSCSTQKPSPASVVSFETDCRQEAIIREPYAFKIGDELIIRNLSGISTLVPSTEMAHSPPELTVRVDNDGVIVIPETGTIHVAGLTRKQLTDTLTARYGTTLRNPVFDVQLTNLGVQVLGSTVVQGIVPLGAEYMRLGEVISRSGGIRYTEAGNTIRIIRSEGSEQRIITYSFDQLDDPLILSQPVFAGDLVYVPPSEKVLRSAASQRNYHIIQPILTAFNLAVIALNIVRYIR